MKEEQMQLRPLGDRVLVKRTEEVTKTAGGIIIPDNNKEKPVQGEVVSTGPGKRNDDGSVCKLDVKEGDKVIFGKYAGSEVKLDGKEYLIMKEDDILGIIQ
jgi:chaperonin GroES